MLKDIPTFTKNIPVIVLLTEETLKILTLVVL